jgi:spore coat polysaccharide biosynthesis protein SpsF (cytidylyltransferase family)
MLAITQARMSSKRLPGKVLRSVAGMPVLGWVHRRLSLATQVSRVVVATSDHASDDPVEEYCRKQGIAFYRGPLDDVAQRFQDCIDVEGAPAFIRVTGDSPLIDPVVIDNVVALFKSSGCELATNVQVRSFPKGQSVEVMQSGSFNRGRARFRDAADREHVTRYFYEHANEMNIRNLSSDEAMGDLQLSIDTAEDLEAIDYILDRAGGDVSWSEAARLRLGLEEQK